MILRVNLILEENRALIRLSGYLAGMKCFLGTFPTPLGTAVAVLDEAGFLRELGIYAAPEAEARLQIRERDGMLRDDAAPAPVAEQLTEYFEGKRRQFTLPVAPEGSAFQRRVWEQLQKIPYGTTTSYGAIAERLGQPGAARAVGLANGANPIAVVVPCHRVVGGNGALTGYAGGLDRKAALLRLEGATGPQQSLFGATIGR